MDFYRRSANWRFSLSLLVIFCDVPQCFNVTALLCLIAEKIIEMFLLNFSCNTSCKAQVFTSCKTLDLQVIIPVKLMSHGTFSLRSNFTFLTSACFFSVSKRVLTIRKEAHVNLRTCLLLYHCIVSFSCPVGSFSCQFST